LTAQTNSVGIPVLQGGEAVKSRVVTFGFDDHLYSGGQRVPVSWDEQFALNGHMLVAGKSGTGKTFTLRRIISQLVRDIDGRGRPRVHAFDVHDDIVFDGESRVVFSESSPYGINPLRLSADPNYGGVRRCVEEFVEMMIESGAGLGPRQAPALKHVLYDLFAERGFLLTDPSTWRVDEAEASVRPDERGRIFLDVPYEDRERAKAAAKIAGVTLQWSTDDRAWWCNAYRGGLLQWSPRVTGRRPPTVDDLFRLLQSRVRRMHVGGSGRCVANLAEHNKKVQAWNKLCQKLARTGQGAQEAEALKEEINHDAMALIETFSQYVLSIESGHEFQEFLHFESVETLRSLVDRVSTLVSAGVFRNVPPPFDEASPIWAYGIAPLRTAEQRLFVWTRLQHIFEAAKERGIVDGASEVREVIVLDEAHKFFAPKETNILDIIAREGRKFGIALIAASQAPAHFSEDFLGTVGTKILLGLDPQYHDAMVRKMGVERDLLTRLVAGKVAAVQVADKRDMRHVFVRTRVGN